MENELERERVSDSIAPPLNRVFIGFDPRQAISFTVAATSLVTTTDTPVAVSPLVYSQLPLTRKGLTPFTWTRFLVPWLCGFKGWAAFLDADAFLRGDINDLFKMADDKYAVMVSDACTGNLAFERAAIMLFNCAHPDNAKLTPEFVNTQDGLHKIGWTENIGTFPGTWHHLVGYMAENPDAKLVHFTQGVPCWQETVDSEHAPEWINMAKVAFSAQPWAELMGHSVHAKPVMERLARARGANGTAATPSHEATPGVA
jgi:hypothetical protein